jgi:hypothetical protein
MPQELNEALNNALLSLPRVLLSDLVVINERSLLIKACDIRGEDSKEAHELGRVRIHLWAQAVEPSLQEALILCAERFYGSRRGLSRRAAQLSTKQLI